MVFVIVLTPFWSAFTDAYVKKDYSWMGGIVRKLECLWLLCIPVLILMVLCSNFLYQWWVGNSVSVSFSLSVCMAVYILFQMGGNVYMYLINGTGKVRLQLMVYIILALVALPLINVCCKQYGVNGVLIVPVVAFALQAIVGRMQIWKIIKNKAKGIWLE